MLIYVRSKKDKDAISHVIEKVYKGSIEIRTLGGKRKDELKEEIEKIVKNPEDFTIILLGSEDRKWIKTDLSNAVVKVDFVPKAKVRNVKFALLVREIERVKARFLLDIVYKENTYFLGKRSNFITEYKLGSDIFLVIWDKYKEILKKNFEINNYPLILHEGEWDIVFSGDIVVGKVYRPLNGDLKFYPTGLKGEDIDFKKFLKENEGYLKQKIEMTVKKIKDIIKKYGFTEIVVPWSGGKDSTLLVILLKKYVKIDFTAVYVNTGLEFKYTENYVREIAEKFNIKYEEVYAGIDKEYREKGIGYLLRRDCTKKKISTLYEFIRKNFENPLVINGDRISESEARSFRPEFRYDDFWILSPIKYWSFLDEQLFFIYNDIPWNPLYSYGFYRVGCYVCPFIDSFEKEIVKKFVLK